MKIPNNKTGLTIMKMHIKALRIEVDKMFKAGYTAEALGLSAVIDKIEAINANQVLAAMIENRKLEVASS